MAHGKDRIKSNCIPCMVKRNGKNVMLMANVADITDMKNSFGAAIVACQRVIP